MVRGTRIEQKGIMKQIVTLNALAKTADQHRSIVCPTVWCFRKPIPAAWMINLSGCMIHRLMKAGMFRYTKARRVKPCCSP